MPKLADKPQGRGAVARETDARGEAGRRIAWVIGLFAWIFIAAALLSLDPADPPGHAVAPRSASGEFTNWMGPAGAIVAHNLAAMLGSGVWVVVLSLGAWLAHIAWKGPVGQLTFRIIGVLLLALAFSGFHALLLPMLSRFPEGGGGLIALFATTELEARFGAFGATLWLILLGVVGLTVAFDNLIIAVPQKLALRSASAARAGGALGRALASRATIRINDLDDDERVRVEPHEAAIVEEKPAPKRKPKTPQAPVEPEAEEPEVESERAPAKKARPPAPPAPRAEEPEDEEDSTEFDPDTLREKIAKLPMRFAGAVKETASEDDLLEIRARNMHTEADQKYVFPGLDLLENPEASYSDELSDYVRDQAEALEMALHEYGIDGEVAGIDSGPVITLYQVRLAPGTKVSSVTSVSSDIARALKAVNLRIVPNTEGLDTVGIEVPNRKKEKVRLKELMTLSDATSKMKLPLFLGKDASGEPLIQDLAEMPHLLMAGTTGSGKSVCMSAIIMGFLYTQKPNDMKLVLVDPKMVELSQFKNIPHLMCPVVTDMGKAAAILEWAVAKMNERYELLAEAACRDINAYNTLSWEELKERFEPSSEAEEAVIPRKLPYMVFVIDELADLMITNKEVEGSIVRIAQKARAVGIHLILATQRPQANVVTGLIKSNMPGRIAFKVSSGMDSRIVLDQKGGEVLLGQGDMLMLTPRSATPLRAQGTLVDDTEIRRVTRFIRDVSEPSFERQLMQIRSGGDPGQATEDHEQRMVQNAQEDPLFDRAVEIVLETKRGSVSLLQRRLAIGYTRASRLVELMGMAGILGGHKGSVAREVMISLEEWEAMKAMAAQDAAQEEESAAVAIPSQPRLIPEPVVARELIESDEASAIARDEEHVGEQAYVELEDDEPDADLVPNGEVVESAEAEEEEEENAEESELHDELDEDTEEQVAEVEAVEEDEIEEVSEDGDSEEADAEEEGEEEYEYVDEDGNPIDEDDDEYEYVDEDGNPIDEDDDEYEYVDEEEEAETEVEAQADDESSPEIKTKPFTDQKRRLGKTG